MMLLDDFGWANAGWHRNYTAPGGMFVLPTPEVQTPHLDSLVADGIDLDWSYVYKYCSHSRSALQSGRNPYHVNPLNAEPDIANPADPVSGFAGTPRAMTGIATKLNAAGYATAAFGAPRPPSRGATWACEQCSSPWFSLFPPGKPSSTSPQHSIFVIGAS